MKLLSVICFLFVFTACDSSTSGSGDPVAPLPPPPSGVLAPKVPSTAEAVYYVGEQTINLTNKVECYVELRFSDDKSFAEVRAIMTNPHALVAEPDHAIVGLGIFELEKKFLAGSLQTNGYSFEDKEPMAVVKQLLIFGDNTLLIGELRAAIFHSGHHDPVSCAQLMEVEDQKLSDILEKYTHFEEYKEHLSGEHDEHDHQ